MRAVAAKQDVNVMFIGSIANWNHDIANYFISLYQHRIDHLGESEYDENLIKGEFFAELDRFKANPFGSFEYRFPGWTAGRNPTEATALLLLTSKMRFDTLSALADLGLRIHGYQLAFPEVMYYNYEIFRCFDFNLSVTLAHTIANHNRAKISLTLPHAQCREGFSWRVCDILASNAALLSPPNADLLELTKGYVELPTYESPTEAREIAQRLLSDDAWRRDLVAASNALVEDRCRFESRFHLMEQELSGLQLLNHGPGSATALQRETVATISSL